MSALSPKNGLGVPLGMVWQCQGTEEVVGAQPASVSSCPSLCPYPCVHADLAHLEVYPCFPVHVCTRVHTPCPPLSVPPHHGFAPPSTHLYTHVPMARGGMAVLRGAVTPGRGWDVSALPPPVLCWAKG